MVVNVVGLSHVVVHEVWAEVDLQVATCSKEPGTGSVLIRMFFFVFFFFVCHEVFCVILKAAVCLNSIVFAHTGVVVTRILPGGWSATSAKHPNQKAWVVVLHSPLAVTEAEVAWECVEAEVWTAVGRRELEAQVAPGGLEVSVEAGEVTVVDSEDAVEWIGEVSVGPDVEDHPWTEWVAEVEEEWARQVEKWT